MKVFVTGADHDRNASFFFTGELIPVKCKPHEYHPIVKILHNKRKDEKDE
jgi:hypothetical protein